jgi:FkbM family methyltransferase
MTIEVKTKAGNFKVNVADDYYGAEFWSNLENGNWEPDTISFLNQRMNNSVDFIDVGAANGSITLLAAINGARVLAFEAEEFIFNIAKRNFELNSNLKDQIEIRNQAVSGSDGTLIYSKATNPKIISSIMFGAGSGAGNTIQVKSLNSVMNEFHQLDRKLIIKIDVEGAEWNILNNLEVLRALAKHKATLLLAVHPGFHRPFRTLPLGLTLISKTIWQIRNILESYFYFKKILSFASILRTNLEPVRKPKKCVMLILGGYFEFILEFGSHEDF